MSIPTSIRIPSELKEWIENRAERNTRSISGELVELMKKAKQEEEKNSMTKK